MNLSTHPKTVNCKLVGCFKSFSTPNKVSTLNNGILRTPSGKGSSSKRNENSPYYLRLSEKKKNQDSTRLITVMAVRKRLTNIGDSVEENMEMLFNGRTNSSERDILNENKQSSSRRNSSEKVKLKQKDQESGEDIKKRYTVGKNKYQKIRNDVELIKLIFPDEMDNIYISKMSNPSNILKLACSRVIPELASSVVFYQVPPPRH